MSNECVWVVSECARCRRDNKYEDGGRGDECRGEEERGGKGRGPYRISFNLALFAPRMRRFIVSFFDATCTGTDDEVYEVSGNVSIS